MAAVCMKADDDLGDVTTELTRLLDLPATTELTRLLDLPAKREDDSHSKCSVFMLVTKETESAAKALKLAQNSAKDAKVIIAFWAMLIDGEVQQCNSDVASSREQSERFICYTLHTVGGTSIKLHRCRMNEVTIEHCSGFLKRNRVVTFEDDEEIKKRIHSFFYLEKDTGDTDANSYELCKRRMNSLFHAEKDIGERVVGVICAGYTLAVLFPKLHWCLSGAWTRIRYIGSTISELTFPSINAFLNVAWRIGKVGFTICNVILQPIFWCLYGVWRGVRLVCVRVFEDGIPWCIDASWNTSFFIASNCWKFSTWVGSGLLHFIEYVVS